MPALQQFYLVLVCLLASLHTSKVFAKELLIGISQIVVHPSLDEIRQGLVDSLSQSKLAQAIKIQYLNAQGDMTISSQIARKLLGDRPNVVVGISTPSSQHLLATKTSLPIVFSGVNDPIAARLVSNLDRPGGNITGVMLPSPIEEQMQLIREIIPSVNKIAIIYNAGEANSVAIAKQFKAVNHKLKLQPIEVSVTSSAQVQSAVQSLIGRADALYLPTDNTVISAVGSIIQAASHGHLPTFAADTASVAHGALAALGVDHYQLGVETAKVVVRILQGEEPASIPVVQALANELHINNKYASAMGVVFPPQVLQKAQKKFLH